MAANLSCQLSSYLLGNWTREFDILQSELRIAIVQINSTRVDPVVAETLATWIWNITSHIKEWVGMVVLILLLCTGCALCLFFLCRLRHRAQRDRVAIHQALLAMQYGDSPMVWLSMLQQA